MTVPGAKFFVSELGDIAQMIETVVKGRGIATLKNVNYGAEPQVGSCNAFGAASKKLP